MRDSKHTWLLGLVITVAVVLIPIIIVIPGKAPLQDDPRSHMPAALNHVDHTAIMKGPFDSGSAVTLACLSCHPDAADQVMHTSHWTWESDSVYSPDHDRMVALGKKNGINNFCISIEGNWPACTKCHVGYGWENEAYDFSEKQNVDCLVCHDQSGSYRKGKKGLPAEGVDLAVAAQSVGSPTRENCCVCQFDVGGGNAV
jgi:hypothetical protein